MVQSDFEFDLNSMLAWNLASSTIVDEAKGFRRVHHTRLLGAGDVTSGLMDATQALCQLSCIPSPVLFCTLENF